MRPVKGAWNVSAQNHGRVWCATYTNFSLVLMLQARLKILEIRCIPLFLVQTLKVFGVVFANHVVSKVCSHNPDGLLAVHCNVVAPVLVGALPMLAMNEESRQRLLTALDQQQQPVANALVRLVKFVEENYGTLPTVRSKEVVQFGAVPTTMKPRG
jgi:hypothetical protein